MSKNTLPEPVKRSKHFEKFKGNEGNWCVLEKVTVSQVLLRRKFAETDQRAAYAKRFSVPTNCT